MTVQLPDWTECIFTPKRYKVFHGGRGGGKSWGVAICLLLIGLTRPIRVLCARELQVSIADSVHKLLSDIIYANPEMEAFYDVQTKAIYGANGTEFAFKGLKHNITEIKSYEGVDYCWVEEAQAVSDKSWETLIPTVRKEDSEIIITFNPKNATDPTWIRFVLDADEDVIVEKINWRDNPFFPQVLEKERIKLQAKDLEAYDHIWEGGFDTRYTGKVYAKYVNQSQVSPKVLHDPNYPVYTAWDMGYGDQTAIWFFQVGINEVFFIDYYEANQEGLKHFAEVCYGREVIVDERDHETGEIIAWHFGVDLSEHIHRKAYNYQAMYLPHDAGHQVQAAGGRSLLSQAQKLGLPAFVVPQTSRIQSREALRQTLPKAWINRDRCSDGLHATMEYHFEYDEDKNVFSKNELHDWSSNGANAMEIAGRVWKDTKKPITQKTIDQKRNHAKFERLRRENGLVKADPYQTRARKR